jgi:hypothetical protein
MCSKLTQGLAQAYLNNIFFGITWAILQPQGVWPPQATTTYLDTKIFQKRLIRFTVKKKIIVCESQQQTKH